MPYYMLQFGVVSAVIDYGEHAVMKVEWSAAASLKEKLARQRAVW